MCSSRQYEKPRVYAVKHKDDEIRLNSRSGGVFTSLSDRILSQGGVVYGCVLSKEFKAIHIRAEQADERNQMRGSKYIQSSMGDIFTAVQSDLKEGRYVLFSGTSCQVTGLRAFLQKEYKTLVCVDIVCHGVPSPKVWEEYLKWQEDNNGGKCISVDFRNKRDFGWDSHVETLTFDNGKRIHGKVFTTLFYGHHILRPCCCQCPYKTIIHPGDITIADYWGIDRAAPGFNDNKGVSLVLINNEVGKKIFEDIENSVQYQECRIEDSMQPPLIKPFEKTRKREQFWQDFNKRNFVYIAKKYGGYGIKNRIKGLVRKGVNLINK